MIPCSQDFLNALNSPMKQLFLKIEFYDQNMNLLVTFDENVSKYQNFRGGTAPNHFSNYGTMRNMSQKRLGAISVDYTRAIRRSFSFGMDNSTNNFDWGPDSVVWLSNRAKIFFGLQIANGTIEYIPQGVFVVTAPTDAHNPKDGKNVYINGQDKAYLMSGTIGKFVNETTIESGTALTTAIMSIAQSAGETMFNFDPVTYTLTNAVTYQGTDSKWTAITDLAALAECIVFYDVNGYLRLQQVVTNFQQEPSVWSYVYGSPTELFYAGNVRALDDKKLANHIRVIGGSSTTPEILYDLIVDETVPYTLSQTIADLVQWQAGTFNNTQAILTPNTAPGIGQLELAQNGTNINILENTQTALESGTLTNLVFTTTDVVDVDPIGSLTLPTDYAIEFAAACVNTNTATTYDAYYYQNIYSTEITIASGDQLAFDCYLEGPAYESSIDAVLSNGTFLRNISPTIVDQNGLALNPTANLSGYANNQWYHRVFSLNAIAGQSITSVQVAFQSNVEGSYTSFFRNIHILDSYGNIKEIIYDASVADTGTFLMPVVAPSSQNTGASSQSGADDYTGVTLSSVTVASILTGTRIEQPLDLSQVKNVSSSSVYVVGNLTNNQGISLQIRTSSNAGSTWSAWSSITSGSAIPNITQGQNLTGFQIQLQETVSTTNPTVIPELSEIQIQVNSEYLASGTFTSNQFSITVTSANPVSNTASISWTDTLSTTSVTMSIELNISTNNGQTWSGYQPVTNGQVLSAITNEVDISQCLFQFQVSMSTTDVTQTPVLSDLTIQANAPIFQNSPYSIQKIGDRLYQHNKGKADPLITELYQAKWRAKYDLMEYLGFTESLTMEVAPNFILDAGDIIYVNDNQNSVDGNYRVISYELPMIPQLVELTVQRFEAVINDWNAI